MTSNPTFDQSNDSSPGSLPGEESAIVVLGKITGFHGLKGAMKVSILDQYHLWLEEECPIITLNLPGRPPKSLNTKLLYFEPTGPNRGLMAVEALTDRTAAEAWNHGQITIFSSQIPALSETERLAARFLQWKVVSQSTQRPIGIVQDVLSPTQGPEMDYFEIGLYVAPTHTQEGTSSTTLPTIIVPYQEAFFPVQDEEQKTLYMQGLDEFVADALAEALAPPSKKTLRKLKHSKQNSRGVNPTMPSGEKGPPCDSPS